jgi:hypothetical protein
MFSKLCGTQTATGMTLNDRSVASDALPTLNDGLRAATKPRGVKQTFVTEEGWKVTVSAKQKGNYHEVEQALLKWTPIVGPPAGQA